MQKNHNSALDIFGVITLWSFAILFCVRSINLHKNYNSCMFIFQIIPLVT